MLLCCIISTKLTSAKLSHHTVFIPGKFHKSTDFPEPSGASQAPALHSRSCGCSFAVAKLLSANDTVRSLSYHRVALSAKSPNNLWVSRQRHSWCWFTCGGWQTDVARAAAAVPGDLYSRWVRHQKRSSESRAWTRRHIFRSHGTAVTAAPPGPYVMCCRCAVSRKSGASSKQQLKLQSAPANLLRFCLWTTQTPWRSCVALRDLFCISSSRASCIWRCRDVTSQRPKTVTAIFTSIVWEKAQLFKSNVSSKTWRLYQDFQFYPETLTCWMLNTANTAS